MQNDKFKILSSSNLHIIAMLLMLGDHLWATVFPYLEVLTCIGRIAFPIFAFLIVEGFFNTSNLKRYIIRILCFAIVSEIPFNLMYGSSVSYIYHQNVLWTFLIALLLMNFMEYIKKKNKIWLTVVVDLLACLAGFIIGTATFVDYYGVGVLTVLVFYLFHERKWWCFAAQFLLLYYLNVEALGGYYYSWTIFGKELEIVQQGFALFALIPIWLYSGHKGIKNKIFQYFCYIFYPLHMIIIYVVWQLLI